LVKGLNVQDSISNVPVGERNKPLKDVVIKEVNIIRVGYDARHFDALKTWNTELPLLEEKHKKEKEEAQKATEEAQKAAKAKTAAAAAEMVPIFNDYKSKATTSSTGLMTYVITKGTGPKVNQGDHVKVWYEGYFTDGTLLDSNRKDLEEKFGKFNPQKEQANAYAPMPMTISPDAQLFAGFKEAAANMRVGEKVFLYVPSHLAYGESGRPPVIKPNTDLVFILEMVEIDK